MSFYTFNVFAPFGDPIPQSFLFSALQASRAVNTVGTATITITSPVMPEVWQRDTRFVIHRHVPMTRPWLLGNTHWFLQKAQWNVSDDTWTLYLKDALSIFERRLIAYVAETLYADKTIENGNDAVVANMLMAYIRENVGALVFDVRRDLSDYVTFQGDLGVGPATEKEASFRDLLPTVGELIQTAYDAGVKLYYDLVPNGEFHYLFRLFQNYLGIDRTQGFAPVIFGPAYNNVTDLQLVWDYSEERNSIYVGGEGEGAGRLVEQVRDETSIARSPFNLRETFYDDRDVDVSTVLIQDGRAQLAKNRAKLLATGKLMDTASAHFGVDYNYGDLVNLKVLRYNFLCLIDAFNISYQNGEEEVEVRLAGELPL